MVIIEINKYRTSAKLNNLSFHQFEVVSLYRNPQFQVAENYANLFNLGLKLIPALKELTNYNGRRPIT